MTRELNKDHARVVVFPFNRNLMLLRVTVLHNAGTVTPVRNVVSISNHEKNPPQ